MKESFLRWKELVKELLGLCSSPVSGCDMVTASYTSKENYPPDTCVWICALGTVTSDIIKNMLGENPPVFGYAVTRVSQM